MPGHGVQSLFSLCVGMLLKENSCEMLFPSLCCACEEERDEDLGSYIILLSGDLGSLLFLFFPLSSSLSSSHHLSGNSKPPLWACSL